MPVVLLIVIYATFVSLGLPDGVFGSAWPIIHASLHVPVGLGSVISLIVTGMTIVSSLATTRLVTKLGNGRLILMSIVLTAFGLTGYSTAHTVWWLIVCAIPLGFGAGAIDSALNNYVATHYKAHHMNWLHAFWGVGATLGPLVFAASLSTTNDWHAGFLRLGIMQAVIAVLVLLTLPLWSRVHRLHATSANEITAADDSAVRYVDLLRQRRAQFACLAFLFYVSVEVSVGLWVASYLVDIQDFSGTSAAFWASIYYAAITAGRIITGFIALRVKTSTLIRIGILTALTGMIVLFVHATTPLSAIGLTLIGLGFAPIYPCLIHRTPELFGKDISGKVMSLQMVGGYLGATTIPPLIGVLSGVLSFATFAVMLETCELALLFVTEYLRRVHPIATD